MNYESGYKSTLAAKLDPADVTMTVATAPTTTSGRLFLKSGTSKEWIKYTGVTGTTLTGLVRGLSQTADPSTAGTGLTWLAGQEVTLVAMHDQIFNKFEDNLLEDGNKIQFGSTSAYIYTDNAGTDLKFRDGNQGADVTLTTMNAAAGANLQGVFDGGQTIVIADTDNQTLSLTNNDTTNNPNCFNIVNTTSGYGLNIEQSGAKDGLFIKQTGNGYNLNLDQDYNNIALNIVSVSTTTPTFQIQGSTTTSQTCNIVSNSLTTGNGMWVYSIGGSMSGILCKLTAANATNTGTVLSIEQASTSTGSGLIIGNSGTGNSSFINTDGNAISINIDSEATTQPAINIDIVDGDAHLRLTGDSTNGSPTEGDLWRESNGLKYYNGTNEFNLLDASTLLGSFDAIYDISLPSYTNANMTETGSCCTNRVETSNTNAYSYWEVPNKNGESSFMATWDQIDYIEVEFRIVNLGSTDWLVGLGDALNSLTTVADVGDKVICHLDTNSAVFLQTADGTTAESSGSVAVTTTNINTYKLTFDGTSAILYVNGAVVATNTTNVPTGTDNVIVGIGNPGNGQTADFDRIRVKIQYA